MKIELKKIKIVRALSQETECFHAQVWVDGKHAADVSNTGHGGCDMWHERERGIQRRIDAHAKATMQARKFGETVIEPDAEWLIADLLAEHQYAAMLRRTLKAKIMFTLAGKPGIYTVPKRAYNYLADEGSAARFREHHKPATILNSIPEAEALAIFIADARRDRAA